MAKKVPTLSARGWLSEISEKADALIAYYITSEHSQSYIYPHQVTSLIYHVQQNTEEPERLERDVQLGLDRYLRRYFENVELVVAVKEIDNEPNRVDIRIDCTITDNGYRYDLGRQIQIDGEQVKKVFDIVNGGES